MKILISALAVAGALIAGTVSASAQVDPYCDQYAKDYAKSRAGGAAIGGAAVGGVGGALLGRVIGGKNAMLGGAVAGALGGGVIGGAAWKKQYNAAYVDCMTNRKPVAAQAPQPGYLPAVGTKQWKQMCSQKYKSFNWETGYYVGYDQQYHLCQLP
ncbi:MAG: BA14K family protein [Bauldia sp.]|nr:BA14K family protein [Bauldia sp.]